ncbi:hypothetical protein PMAYCL1PPCAC_03527, partial [Pristionchus mayeri]
QSPICPSTPVEGEPAARLYLVSVIFANGSHHIYDNDPVSKIRWDEALSTYFFLHEFDSVRYETEIFAATCTYKKA